MAAKSARIESNRAVHLALLVTTYLLAITSIANGQIQTLSFTPIDTAYSPALDRIVMVSGSPDQLHVYDPNTGTDNHIDLPGTPTQVSVSPSGWYAAVALPASIEYVDLRSALVIRTFPLTGTIVLSPGFIYVFSGGTITSVPLDGSPAISAANSFPDASRGIYNLTFHAIYAVSSVRGNLYRYDTSAGPIGAQTAGPVSGATSPGRAALWLSSDHTLIYTSYGTIYHASANPGEDMHYSGTFFTPNNISADTIQSVASNARFGQTAFIEQQSSQFVPGCSFNLSTCEDTADVQAFFTAKGDSNLAQSIYFNYNHGRWMYFSARSDWMYIVVEKTTPMNISMGFFVERISPYVPVASEFVPITPCRALDTRYSSSGSLEAGETRRLSLLDICGSPSSATAFALNVTAIPRGPLGFLTAWPNRPPRPLTSILNSEDGRTKANATLLRTRSGQVDVFASDVTDIILDANGYFVPTGSAPQGLAFYPLPPCRIADTRNSTSALGGPALGADQLREFPILESSCGIPASAQAYSLNLTAIPLTGTIGYLSVWPSGEAQPGVSTLNARDYAVTSNSVIVKSGVNGSVTLFSSDATNVVLDVNGYFAPQNGTGLSFYSSTPCRILDTRDLQPFSGLYFPSVQDSCGANPQTSQALVVNATVVPRGSLGSLTLFDQQQSQLPTLTAFDGSVTSNLAIIAGNDRDIGAYASDETDLILDLIGFFAP